MREIYDQFVPMTRGRRVVCCLALCDELLAAGQPTQPSSSSTRFSISPIRRRTAGDSPSPNEQVPRRSPGPRSRGHPPEKARCCLLWRHRDFSRPIPGRVTVTTALSPPGGDGVPRLRQDPHADIEEVGGAGDARVVVANCLLALPSKLLVKHVQPAGHEVAQVVLDGRHPRLAPASRGRSAAP
jgi:hypothetical protein